jgi:hypothetical protein
MTFIKVNKNIEALKMIEDTDDPCFKCKYYNNGYGAEHSCVSCFPDGGDNNELAYLNFQPITIN